MGQKYLLDTNVVLDFMGRKLPENSKVLLSKIIDDQINISAINKMELLGFTHVEQNLIAATSIVNNFILISHDVKDFQKIEELQFLDSYFM